jgi:serine/threonine protein phosphatase PrpC
MENGRGAPSKQSIRASFQRGGSIIVLVRAVTDVGLKRTNNEDNYGAWLPEDVEERERRGLLLTVADGMGGVKGGEVASRITVEAVMHAYRESPGLDVADDLRAAVVAANDMVHRESLKNPELNGMGTTCTAAVVRGRELYLAHVGDSRAYLVRSGRVRQLTHDHSLVGQLVRDRQLTAEQAKTDPRRNVVTRSVGIGEDVEVDAERVAEPLRHGDVLVLCTDGLHGLVSDDELGAAVKDQDLDGACDTLITLAKKRGAPDNITVILARAQTTAPEEFLPTSSAERLSRARSSPNLAMLIVACLMLLLLALFALGLLLLRRNHEPRPEASARPGRATAGAA